MSHAESEANHEQRPARLMRWKEVEEVTGLPHRTLADMSANGWFPKPVRVSSQLVAFFSNEIEDWMSNLKNRRVKYRVRQHTRRPETLGYEAEQPAGQERAES